MKTIEAYQCEVCDRKHLDSKDAVACEANHARRSGMYPSGASVAYPVEHVSLPVGSWTEWKLGVVVKVLGESQRLVEGSDGERRLMYLHLLQAEEFLRPKDDA